MDFGKAIEALKEGKKVTREGWNGKGMYLAYQKGTMIPSEFAKGGVVQKLAEEGQDFITILPHIDMRTADGKVCIGWLASQADMLAEDWWILS